MAELIQKRSCQNKDWNKHLRGLASQGTLKGERCLTGTQRRRVAPPPLPRNSELQHQIRSTCSFLGRQKNDQNVFLDYLKLDDELFNLINFLDDLDVHLKSIVLVLLTPKLIRNKDSKVSNNHGIKIKGGDFCFSSLTLSSGDPIKMADVAAPVDKKAPPRHSSRGRCAPLRARCPDRARKGEDGHMYANIHFGINVLSQPVFPT